MKMRFKAPAADLRRLTLKGYESHWRSRNGAPLPEIRERGVGEEYLHAKTL